jgi:hypothetical protein
VETGGGVAPQLVSPGGVHDLGPCAPLFHLLAAESRQRDALVAHEVPECLIAEAFGPSRPRGPNAVPWRWAEASRMSGAGSLASRDLATLRPKVLATNILAASRPRGLGACDPRSLVTCEALR